MGNKEVPTEHIIHSPEGKAYNPSNWANRVFRPFMQRLHKEYPEIPMLSPHLLRHTYITRLFESGLDIKEIQYLAGHTTVDMTLRVYTHYQHETRQQDTANKVCAALG